MDLEFEHFDVNDPRYDVDDSRYLDDMDNQETKDEGIDGDSNDDSIHKSYIRTGIVL